MLPTFNFNKDVAGEAFKSKDCPAIVVYTLAVAAYGEDLHDPETMESMEAVELWLRIKQDFRVTCSEETENRINAMRLALETDLFENDPDAFVAICKAIAYGDITDSVTAALEDLSVAEIGLALQEIKLVTEDEFNFSKSVREVIAEEMLEEAMEAEGTPAIQLLEENRKDILDWFTRLEADGAALTQI